MCIVTGRLARPTHPNSKGCSVQAGVPITRGFRVMGWKLRLGGAFRQSTYAGCPNLPPAQPQKWVPHPCAFCAQGWVWRSDRVDTSSTTYDAQGAPARCPRFAPVFWALTWETQSLSWGGRPHPRRDSEIKWGCPTSRAFREVGPGTGGWPGGLAHPFADLNS